MKKIIDCESGEVIERQLNKAEKDQQKVDEAAAAIEKAEAEIKATARQELLNKLGITSDEAKLLLG